VKKKCYAPECDRHAEAKGLCIMHYSRKARTGTLDKHITPISAKEKGEKICLTCAKPFRLNPHYSRQQINRAKYCSRKCAMTKHGKSYSREWSIWSKMKDRCLNPSAPPYTRYGARGITVCPEWLESFEAFYADMGDVPEGMSLERMDNNRGYNKENCKWATAAEQAKNKSNNRRVTIDGQTMLLCEWADHLGLSRSTVLGRVSKGWSEVEAILTPIDDSRRNGRAKNGARVG
jgi:hypothetical protein